MSNYHIKYDTESIKYTRKVYILLIFPWSISKSKHPRVVTLRLSAETERRELDDEMTCLVEVNRYDIENVVFAIDEVDLGFRV